MKTRTPGSLQTPVKQGSVVSLVINRIKEALIQKELKPGEFLPTEHELMRNLGVSKTSIREAIKMLQALGVVEMKRGQGTMIRTHADGNMIDSLIFQLIIESGQPLDIVELRRMFEPACAVLAMQKATQEDIALITAAHRHFEDAVLQGQHSVEHDRRFHLAILHATHNPFVIRIGETIYQLFKAAMAKSLQGRPRIAIHDHANIIQAFCAKDEERLRNAIIQSFSNWKTGL